MNLDSYYSNTSANFDLFAGIGLLYLIVSVVISLFMIVSMWKIFKKAGKNGWEAIIPIYNIYVLFEIGGQKGAYIFFLLIPCVGQIIFLVFEIKALIELSRRFGKGTGFGILCLFFPIIGFPILAFSGATYQAAAVEPESSILDVNTTGVPENQEFNYGYENQDTVAMNPVNANSTPSEVITQTPETEVTEQNQTVNAEVPAEQPVSTPVENSSTEAPAQVETPVEPVSTPVENPSTEAPAQVETPVEAQVNQVDRFHTPSALDNNNNQN